MKWILFVEPTNLQFLSDFEYIKFHMVKLVEVAVKEQNDVLF
jgi:hypothetical protein